MAHYDRKQPDTREFFVEVEKAGFSDAVIKFPTSFFAAKTFTPALHFPERPFFETIKKILQSSDSQSRSLSKKISFQMVANALEKV